MPPSRPRRRPQQARSRARFDAILDAADAVFLELGYDEATTNHIAAAADTSIGSIYRFFPDKEAILVALAERYGARMLAVGAEVTGDPAPLDARVSRGVDRFAAFLQENPGFLTLMRQAAHPALAPGRGVYEAQMMALMGRGFEGARVKLDAAERRAIVEVCHVALSALQMQAALAADPDHRRALLEETKRLITAYLTARLGLG